MSSAFPFGRPAVRRPPRRPEGPAELLVLGVYPSALHVRWQRPDGVTIGAMAVDDEPEVFWDGCDAARRIDVWRAAVGWRDEWGRVGRAGPNGFSGRSVRDAVLAPLGVSPERTYFTDCLPYYFVKGGEGSQRARIDEVYRPFAIEHSLPAWDLPPRPDKDQLVARSLAEEADVLGAQIAESGASRIVTLGQEAADVLAGCFAVARVLLRPDAGYGVPRPLARAGRATDWIPLTHPGNRTPVWTGRHRRWAAEARSR